MPLLLEDLHMSTRGHPGSVLGDPRVGGESVAMGVAAGPSPADDFRLGVMMLDTRFPRPVGDIGNAASFDHPVRFARVTSASVPAVVNSCIAETIVEDFVDAGLRLVNDGVSCLATSCGFVCAIHDRLQARLPVPLVSSALNLVPWLHEGCATDGPIGVLTFDARVLGRAHFGRFWRDGLVIQGLEASETFYPTIRFDRRCWDPARVEQEVFTAADALQRRAPDMQALLLECTNLAPYRQRLRARLGIAVADIHTAIQRVRCGVERF